MSDTLLSSVVDALRFPSADANSPEAAAHAQRPLPVSTRQWARHLGVLDRTGLTLPFYARLLAANECARLPKQIVEAFEQRRRDNTLRMNGMLQTFGHAVDALQNAHVHFLCVKGFSLCPDFLEESWQRHQVDFDFLVAPAEVLRAQAALEQIGYKLTGMEEGERRLRLPVTQVLSHHAYLYQPQQGAAIELHTGIQPGGPTDFRLARPETLLAQSEIHTAGSISFPRLSRANAFLYQVLHVFRHFLGSWARLLWIYEIANYVERHRGDDVLWQDVCALLSSNSDLNEAAALVLLIAQELFACHLPPALERACALDHASPIALWVKHYARPWLFTDMPGNKLNLLLQRHFFSDHRAWRRYLARRLAPRGQSPVLCEGVDPKVAKSFSYRAGNLRFRATRIWHHLRTGTEFTFASASWAMRLRSSQVTRPSIEMRRSES
jgi:hypothetical protein